MCKLGLKVSKSVWSLKVWRQPAAIYGLLLPIGIIVCNMMCDTSWQATHMTGWQANMKWNWEDWPSTYTPCSHNSYISTVAVSSHMISRFSQPYNKEQWPIVFFFLIYAYFFVGRTRLNIYSNIYLNIHILYIPIMYTISHTHTSKPVTYAYILAHRNINVTNAQLTGWSKLDFLNVNL